MLILVVNPGGTSTKIELFDGETSLHKWSLLHTAEDLRPFASIFEELPYRRGLIAKALAEAGVDLAGLSAVVGRGGLMKPLPGGVYAVCEAMIEDMRAGRYGEHASNLGAALARELAAPAACPAFVVDPVSVDEFEPVARVTGLPELTWPSWLHALNHKAVARHVAAKLGKEYGDCNFIVAHLGSGVSVAAHCKGRMVDGSGGRCNGPFSPERCGALPAYPLVELCYSGRFSRGEMVRKMSSEGGFYAYLGSKDVAEAEARAAAGDEKAKLIFQAFLYQVCKDMASYGAVLHGQVDRIILSGGIACSAAVQAEVRQRLSFLAPLEIVPGEMEMQALAQGALRVLMGSEKPCSYTEGSL